jgi:hypothetical protein
LPALGALELAEGYLLGLLRKGGQGTWLKRPSAEKRRRKLRERGLLDPVSDAELERGILDAVKMGLGDVARTLAAQLEARQRTRAGNVVTLDPSKRRGR